MADTSLRLYNLSHPSSSTANLTLAADGSVSGGLPTAGRNLIYNGAMQVAQRGTSTASAYPTGVSSTGTGYYTADRWKMEVGSLGSWTQTVEADGPTGSGLTKSLKINCYTASASPANGGLVFVRQMIEGQDLQRVAKGTASAQQMTLSFWVKSNKTGTYVVEASDDDNSYRFFSNSYTINSSATWEKKTIVIPADTTGAWDNDHNVSLSLSFWLAAGSNYTSGSLQTSWAAYTGANRAAGQTNLAAAANNYWQITGVQLEVGPVATPFEFESFETTLRKCQRYYETGTAWLRRQNWDQGGRTSFEPIGYKVSKRSDTVTVSNTNSNTQNLNQCIFYSTDASSGYISWIGTGTYPIDFQAKVAWTATSEM